MAIPNVTPLPRAPSRADGQEAFNQYADPFIAAMPPMVVQVNASLTWIGQQVTTIDGYRQAAATSATASATSATAAANSATQATTNGATQVTLAAAQAQAAAAAKTDAQAALASTQAVAAAAQSSAGLPSLVGNAYKVLGVNSAANGVGWVYGLPNASIAKTGQSVMLAADKSPYWGYAGQQVGDILFTARNPGALYLPANGSIRSQSSYPVLFAALGLIGGVIGTAWADYDFGGASGVHTASLSGTVIVWQSATVIRRSTDRGQTWANITTPTLLGGAAADIKTDGAGTWIILSSITSAPYQCLRSTDDGLTWQSVTLPATSSGAAGVWIKLIYCGNGVWMASSSYSLTMLRSANGGASWVTITHGYPVGSIAALCANGNGTVLISGYDGSNYTVKKSIDNGQTFSNFLTLASGTNCISTDGQGTWIIALNGINALRSFDDAASSSSFTSFTITGGVGSNTDIAFVSGLILYLFSGSGAKVIIQAANGSFSSQSSAANVTGKFSSAGNGTIFASSTTANRLSRSVQQFGYDTSTQFALPNPQLITGVAAYIKALEAA